jgi:hypothetical protein
VDEATAVLRARRLLRTLTRDQVLAPVESYLAAIEGLPSNIILRRDDSLGADEAGHTVSVSGKNCIILNANDLPERQRFTACHEVAHIVLGLPTEHENASTPFARRPLNERICDVFAAELLLPRHLFQSLVEQKDLGFESIEELAKDFGASLAATGSRFAAACDRPCAFVLTTGGTIRYASLSKVLREHKGWIRLDERVPERSMAGQILQGAAIDGPIEVDASEWFQDWKRGGVLAEDCRHSPRWSQTLSLLWFGDDQVLTSNTHYVEDDDEEAALQPLDGVLPWPGRSRRRP